MAGIPLWLKGIIVVVTGLLAYSLMQAAEYSRQDYELSICVSNTTGTDVCQFSSASDPAVRQGAVAVGAMCTCAIAANAFAPPTFKHMTEAFVVRHLIGIAVWYFFSWALTLVPLIYTSYLLWEQSTNSGANLAQPSTSDLLLGLEEDAPYNPCNPNNIYCPSIPVGLLAGFGYLFAGATAFWMAWLMMDDAATRICNGEDLGDGEDTSGAYFSAVAAPSMRQPLSDDKPNINQPR